MNPRYFASLACLSVLAAIATLAVAQEADKEAKKPVVLKVGDNAPEFTARDDAGEEWKSEEHVGKKILVVYFYPKDMTPGCTTQACNYRDAQKELAAQDVEVIGVSADTVESHQEFKKKEKLNFTLLADPKGEIAKAFGVALWTRGDSIMAQRWTFVIDVDGKIAYKDDDVDHNKDLANVLKIVAGLKKPGKTTG